MRLRLSEAARQELRNAVASYRAIDEPTMMRFIGAVRTEFGLIRDHPLMFAYYEAGSQPSKYRRTLVKRFPFVIVYEVVDRQVNVVAVAHTAREPGYWERR